MATNADCDQSHKATAEKCGVERRDENSHCSRKVRKSFSNLSTSAMLIVVGLVLLSTVQPGNTQIPSELIGGGAPCI